MNNDMYINRYLMSKQIEKNNTFNRFNKEEGQAIIANTCIKIKMKIDDNESTEAIYFKKLNSFVNEHEILDVKVEQCPDDSSFYYCLLSISQNNHANQLLSGDYQAYYYICNENRDVVLKGSKEEWNDTILKIKKVQPSLL
jgi:hypothetical protein